MGYIKSRVNGTVQGMYCDICGKEYVRVVSNPNNSSQDMCVKCYNDFYNGGQQKDKQIEELKAENEMLKQQLKEKDEEIDKLTSKLDQANEIINNPDTLIFQQQELIDNLQKTIEEKNKEIERLNACVDFYKSYYISFKEKVIDELEKVKDYFIEGYAVCKSFSDFYWNFTEQIDNQIKQLKGMK